MRTWVILIAVFFVGAFMFLAIVVVPISNLFQEDVTMEATVTFSSNGQCVVDTPDQRAKLIKHCDLPEGT